MFKKGQFIKDKDTYKIFKIIKISKDLGNNSIYILRPKGNRTDKQDIEHLTKYVNENFILAKKIFLSTK